MAKKKIKASKAKQQTKEKRYFMGALLTMGGLLVIGIAAVVLFGTGGTTLVSGSGDHSALIQNDMESKHGAQWRALGLVRWQYNTGDTMFYVDPAKWGNLSIDERKKRMNQVGRAFGEIVGTHGGDPKQVYAMFHDSVNTGIMLGTYSGVSGAQIQQ